MKRRAVRKKTWNFVEQGRWILIVLPLRLRNVLC